MSPIQTKIIHVKGTPEIIQLSIPWGFTKLCIAKHSWSQFIKCPFIECLYSGTSCQGGVLPEHALFYRIPFLQGTVYSQVPAFMHLDGQQSARNIIAYVEKQLRVCYFVHTITYMQKQLRTAQLCVVSGTHAKEGICGTCLPQDLHCQGRFNRAQNSASHCTTEKSLKEVSPSYSVPHSNSDQDQQYLCAQFCSRHVLYGCFSIFDFFFLPLLIVGSCTNSLYISWLVLQRVSCPAATHAVCFRACLSSASRFIQKSSKQDERKHRLQWFTDYVTSAL